MEGSNRPSGKKPLPKRGTAFIFIYYRTATYTIASSPPRKASRVNSALFSYNNIHGPGMVSHRSTIVQSRVTLCWVSQLELGLVLMEGCG